jgi:hypothetical protein
MQATHLHGDIVASKQLDLVSARVVPALVGHKRAPLRGTRDPGTLAACARAVLERGHVRTPCVHCPAAGAALPSRMCAAVFGLATRAGTASAVQELDGEAQRTRTSSE